jgi:tyrosyl-tRNA synthetase
VSDVSRTFEILERMSKKQLIQYLKSRGSLHQCTNEAKLEAYCNSNRAAYLGIDPTAPSLHVGHLVGIVALKRLTEYGGFRPIALLGGATALIGDPTGRSEERTMLTEQFVENNVVKIERTLKNLLGSSTLVVNNREWYTKDMSALALLRDIGRHFRVSTMLSREAVKTRLDVEGGGLSFTELSYQLLQGNDFKKLYDEHKCVVQLGGSDQWGNIVSGIELIQKINPKSDLPVGLTVPLVTVGGVKLGKTSGNVPVWLDSDLTTDFDFYQYFMRLDDTDASNMILMLTESEESLSGGERQRLLAKLVTSMVRGEESAANADRLSRMLFATEFQVKDATQLLNAAKSAGVQGVMIPHTDINVVEALMKTGLVQSQNEGRRLISSGGVYVNGEKLTSAPTSKLSGANFIQDRVCLIRSGKAKWAILQVQ